MNAAALILFPDNFGDARPAPAAPRPPPEPMFTAAELAAAREAGMTEGLQAAREDRQRRHSDEIAALLVVIAEHLRAARDAAALAAEQSATALARLLIAALGAAFPALLARHGEAEICRVAAAVLPPLLRDPGVVVRVHPDHVEAVAGIIAELSPQSGAPPAIEASDAVARGNVVILWEDGSALRDTGAAWAAITAILQDAVAE